MGLRETYIPPEHQAISQELLAYMQDLYGEPGGYVKIWASKNRKGNFYKTEVLQDPEKLAGILSSHRFTAFNLYMSIGTYKTIGSATEGNLLDVRALCVDCDYSALNPGISVEEAVKRLILAILDGVVPFPTYIEYSRNMRLIYVLNEPFKLVKDKKKLQGSITWLKRIMQVMCDKLNAVSDFSFNAEPHKLTSFVRVPGSVNVRTEGRYDFESGEWVTTKRDNYDVILSPFSDKVDIQRLADTVLPEVFDGYEGWKAKKKAEAKRTRGIVKIESSKDLSTRRLDNLRRLQAARDVGYREKMCYLFWLFSEQSGLDEEAAEAATLEFNQGFKTPLKDTAVKSQCRPAPFINGKTGERCQGKERKFSDAAIRKLLDISDESEGFSGMSNAEKCKNYKTKKRIQQIEAGETKAQKIDTCRKITAEMRKQGKTYQEIADYLGVSLRTAKNYGKVKD